MSFTLCSKVRGKNGEHATGNTCKSIYRYCYHNLHVHKVVDARLTNTLFRDDEGTRPTPTKALKRMVYQRDKGICCLCGKRVDPFDFEIGHNRAHSRGGKLTLKNTILLHPACNRSMRTLTLKQVKATLGLPATPEEKAKKVLSRLSMRELRHLAKIHRVKVKGRVSEGFFSETHLPPSKRQFVNALAKELTETQILREVSRMPKPKKKSKKKSGWSIFG